MIVNMLNFQQTSDFHPALTLFLHSHWQLGRYGGNQGLGTPQPEGCTLDGQLECEGWLWQEQELQDRRRQSLVTSFRYRLLKVP